MRKRGILPAAALVVSLLPVAGANAAAPNAVLQWNGYAIDALVNAPTAPVPGAGLAANVAIYDLAIVEGAVYDAVNSIDGGHEALIDAVGPAPASASQDAAAATASHHVLMGLVPGLPQNVKDRLDTLYAGSLAAIPDGQAKADGIAAGAAAASAMLTDREGDGRFGPFRFAVGTDPGEWRPTLPAFVNDPNAWVARLRPFTLRSTSQFRSEGMPDLTSDQYTAEYNEVKALGSATGSSRTPEQAATAAFFMENPLPLFNRAMRTIAMNEGLSTADSARLFGMIGIAGGDAVIACWDNKAFHSNWRPITAIREGDNDTNPDTVGQADWLPLLPTPPYPDVASGYNCNTAAVWYSARAFFGTDRYTFTVHSNASGADRTYDRFSWVTRDTVDARIYQGLHFRTADLAGAWIGKKVATWVAHHEFEPVD
jgi:hypothetical protein